MQFRFYVSWGKNIEALIEHLAKAFLKRPPQSLTSARLFTRDFSCKGSVIQLIP